MGPPRLAYNGYRDPFPGAEPPGSGINQPSLTSAKVKERVELYYYY